jgi:alpha-tubulin suppressor-like RCC1 family protein
VYFDYSCASVFAVLTNGQVFAWGDNEYGQLGLGDTTPRLTPTLVPGISNIVQVGAANNSVIARTAGGDVYAWGNNSAGSLSLGVADELVLHPTKVPGIPRVVDVTVNVIGKVIAADQNGKVWTWGIHLLPGKGGVAEWVVGEPPVKDPVLSGIVDVETAWNANFALTADGRVYSWGSNAEGTLGRPGSTVNYEHPKVVSGLPPIEKVGLKLYTVVALAKDGTVWTWGDQGDLSLLGRGENPFNPALPGQVAGLTGVKDIAVNMFFSDPIALKSNGEVWGWGRNSGGTLGDGTYDARFTPVRVHHLGNVKKIFPVIAWTYAIS